MSRIRPHLTYSNVMSTIAVFGVLAGGSAWAASKIGTNQIKNGAVTAKKLHKNAVTTKKIKNNAVTGKKLVAPEAFHLVGAAGEPAFASGASNSNDSQDQPAAFYKDNEGVVHLQGVVVAGTGGNLFNLPPGYRPPSGKEDLFTVSCSGTCAPGGSNSPLFIIGAGLGSPPPAGAVAAFTAGSNVSLDGVTFRAGG
jgi:hypothetical protein